MQVGLAMAQAVRAQTSANYADTARQAVQQAIAQVPSNAVLTMQAATRDTLRGFTGMAAGAQAMLGEQNRAGLFCWQAGDYSAAVTADPYEGLYVKATGVAPTQGAWVRAIKAGTYLLDWWNPTQFGDNGNVILGSVAGILALLEPSGCVLEWGENIVRVKAMTTFTAPIAILGINPTISRCVNADGGNWVGNGSLLIFRASYSGVRNVGFSGWIVNQNASQAQCIAFQPLNGTTPQTDIFALECEFDRTCVPIVVFAADNVPSSTGEASFSSPTRVLIKENVMTTCRYGALLFGPKDVEITGNVVRADPQANSTLLSNQGWTSCFRVQGSVNVNIHDNDLEPLEYTSGAALSALRLDQMAYNLTLRKLNYDIRFQNNRVKGGTRLYDIKDFSSFTIGGNSWINATNDATMRAVYEVSPDNTSIYRFGEVAGEDAAYIGVSQLMTGTGGGLAPQYRGRFRAGVRTMVTNKRQSDNPPADNAMVRINYPVFQLIDFTGYDILGYPLPGGAFDFYFTDSSGLTLIIRDCVFPERVSGGLLNTNSTPINSGDPSTSLTFLATIGSVDVTTTPNSYRRQLAGLYTRMYGA